ncbi:MAG: polyprenyl synthetase family protein [Solitalea-like symbiont of Tyrophagus putrescentiae]
MNLDEIKLPITNELILFNALLKETLYSKNVLLRKILNYILKKKGKQIRPIIVLLSAKLCGLVTTQSLRAAVLVEILHTASLVHDDVVDNTFKRRGIFSINAVWRNKLAVLTGDFMFAQTLLATVKNSDYKLLEIYSDSIKKMSEGEIIQIESSRKNLIDEKTYLKIIYNKTASLFAACCQAGATSACQNDSIIYKAKMIGSCMGMIFQIKDDLLDITSKKLNKTTDSDFMDKKITLPLIYALKNAKKKSEILKIINGNNREKHIDTVTQFIIDNNGIDDSMRKINTYEIKALKILDSFNDSNGKEALKNLISYVSNRAH